MIESMFLAHIMSGSMHQVHLDTTVLTAEMHPADSVAAAAINATASSDPNAHAQETLDAAIQAAHNSINTHCNYVYDCAYNGDTATCSFQTSCYDGTAQHTLAQPAHAATTHAVAQELALPAVITEDDLLLQVASGTASMPAVQTCRASPGHLVACVQAYVCGAAEASWCEFCCWHLMRF
mmetsp:Transcript_53330/g.141369  ORF Transcript_53330/g.141369 Transcript_53330/m.141369 type:complete len:180 (-) Transcript_53330:733-1272(-)